MKKERKINRVRCDIQSHIIAAGYTQKEAVEAGSAEYGWSDSDSNFSAKLSDQTCAIGKRWNLLMCWAMRLSGRSGGKIDREQDSQTNVRRIPCCRKEYAYSH